MIRPRKFIQSQPFITIVQPAPRQRIWQKNKNRARARHIAVLRFEQEHHVFVAAYTPWFEDHLDGSIGVMLTEIELEDLGTENRSTAELERAIGAIPNHCRRCGQVLRRDGICDHCPGLPKARDEG